MKRFITKTLMMTLPIIGVILYYVLAVEPHKNGDLGRLGFLPFDDTYESKINHTGMDTLYVTNIENMEQTFPDSTILTIGDSFSLMGLCGYQNYLAKLYPGYTIYNLTYQISDSIDGTSVNFQRFVDMLASDVPLPRIIIMECVERILASRLYNLTFHPHAEAEKATTVQTTDTKAASVTSRPAEKPAGKTGLQELVTRFKDDKEQLKKDLQNTSEYVRKRLNIDNPVKHLKLRQKMFSCKGAEDDLFFFKEDLTRVTEEYCATSRLKLDTLLHLTEQKGIKFVFMVPADKYDLYKDFAIKDKYQVAGQLSFFGQYNNNPHFLNCKELLYPLVEQGGTDIYRCNDTHWSPIASECVAQELKRRLDIQEAQ